MIRYPCLKRCGPIETFEDYTGPRRSLSLSMSEKTWPNWNTGGSDSPRSSSSSIHVWEDVAQLKPGSSLRPPEARGAIHFCWEVAQLKPDRNKRQENDSEPYPCLRRRGPIETLKLREVLQTLYSIHVWKDVAQLKHKIGLHPFALTTYPCLKGRGPIETVLCISISLMLLSIHVWKDVAQLNVRSGETKNFIFVLIIS